MSNLNLSQKCYKKNKTQNQPISNFEKKNYQIDHEFSDSITDSIGIKPVPRPLGFSQKTKNLEFQSSRSQSPTTKKAKNQQIPSLSEFDALSIDEPTIGNSVVFSTNSKNLMKPGKKLNFGKSSFKMSTASTEDEQKNEKRKYKSAITGTMGPSLSLSLSDPPSKLKFVGDEESPLPIEWESEENFCEENFYEENYDDENELNSSVEKWKKIQEENNLAVIEECSQEGHLSKYRTVGVMQRSGQVDSQRVIKLEKCKTRNDFGKENEKMDSFQSIYTEEGEDENPKIVFKQKKEKVKKEKKEKKSKEKKKKKKKKKKKLQKGANGEHGSLILEDPTSYEETESRKPTFTDYFNFYQSVGTDL